MPLAAYVKHGNVLNISWFVKYFDVTFVADRLEKSINSLGEMGA